MPSRDRGRRAKGNGDRIGAVAEVGFVDAGRPEGRQTKTRHRAGGGLEAGRGTRGGQIPINSSLFHIVICREQA